MQKITYDKVCALVKKQILIDAKVECSFEFAQILLIELIKQTKYLGKRNALTKRYKTALISADKALDAICNEQESYPHDNKCSCISCRYENSK